jgi:hypothetical protein
MFSPSFRTQNGIADSTVESFLHELFGSARNCSTFRVRGAQSANRLALRLKCGSDAYDAGLEVDGAGLIANLTGAVVGEPF